MTATVSIQEGNGSTGSPSWSTITSGRYCVFDTATPGDNYPCVVPTTGYNYSFWKHHRLYVSGTFTKVYNIRWFTSGSVKSNWNLGSGGMLLVARLDNSTNGHGCPTANYQQAVGNVDGSSGIYIKDAGSGHSYYKSQTIDPGDADSYTSSAPLLVDTTEITASGSSTKSVVTQVKVAPGAVQGDKPNETFTFRYDEI